MSLRIDVLANIRGNRDRQLVDRPVKRWGHRTGPSVRRQASGVASNFTSLELEAGILLCHGSPDDDLEYLLEGVRENGVHLASPDTIKNRLGNLAQNRPFLQRPYPESCPIWAGNI
jgi:hypothetical protein